MNVTAVSGERFSCTDVPRSAEFYQRIFGFSNLECDDRFCLTVRSASAGRRFFPDLQEGRASLNPIADARGILPPHEGAGQGTSPSGFPPMSTRVGAATGGKWHSRSKPRQLAAVEAGAFIFRDPDGHLGDWSTQAAGLIDATLLTRVRPHPHLATLADQPLTRLSWEWRTASRSCRRRCGLARIRCAPACAIWFLTCW